VRRLRILLADDHTLVRHGLRKILEERADWEVVAEAANGREAVNLTLQHRPDVAVLDIAMPLLNGTEATRQIVRRAPEVQVLILSMHADEAYITEVLHAGAKGYLLKDAADVELLRAVTAVAAGKSFFSPAAARVMLDDYVRSLSARGITDRYETLSEREREIFQLIAEGRTNNRDRRNPGGESEHRRNPPSAHHRQARSPQHGGDRAVCRAEGRHQLSWS